MAASPRTAREFAGRCPGLVRQPWMFAVRDHGIDLFIDRTRSLPVVDPEARELTLSCGAALFNLRLAMRAHGFREAVELFPDPTDGDLLARLVVEPGGETMREDEILFEAMPRRHTNRHPFEERVVPPSLAVALAGAADEEGAWLHVVDGPGSRRAVIDLTRGAETILWEDERYRRELSDWLHSRRRRRAEGIPGSAPGLADLDAFLGPEDGTEASAGSSRVLAVLGTRSDTPNDWLTAGQALERVLLRAQAEGVSASYLNQPVEVGEMRFRLRDAVGEHGFPQIVLRLGYGPEVGPTPRRSVDEVLIS